MIDINHPRPKGVSQENYPLGFTGVYLKAKLYASVKHDFMPLLWVQLPMAPHSLPKEDLWLMEVTYCVL